MPSITEPLRLAVGSHQAGSGKGCAMNVISWESGDKQISDLPACSDRLLAKIVQRANDTICTHRTADLLCPECSQVVLALGHRTVGTGTVALTDVERQQVWVAIAADQARQVLHLVPVAHCDAALAAIEAAEAWANEPSSANRVAAREAAGKARSASASAYAAAAAAAAAYAYAYAAADAYAAAYAAAAAYAYVGAARLRLAHRAVDLFEKLTQHTAAPVSETVTACAVQKMLETTR